MSELFLILRSLARFTAWTLMTTLEIVLSTLLESFRFFPTQDIHWNMDFHHSPAVVDSYDSSPKLPLKLSIIEK